MYIDVFKKYALVTKLESCGVYDWKEAAKSFMPDVSTWHVKFSTCKRFIIQHAEQKTKKRRKTISIITLRGEQYYENDTGVNKSIFKRGCYKTISHLQLPEITKGTQVKIGKTKDVKKLLTKHFGENWSENTECVFYKNVFNNLEVQNNNQIFNNEEVFCEAREAETILVEKEMFI